MKHLSKTLWKKRKRLAQFRKNHRLIFPHLEVILIHDTVLSASVKLENIKILPYFAFNVNCSYIYKKTGPYAAQNLRGEPFFRTYMCTFFFAGVYLYHIWAHYQYV